MGTTSYAVALGSNRRHGRHGSPAGVIAAAVTALAAEGLVVRARSDVRTTPAMGPAGRSFANAAVVVSTDLTPQDLLIALKAIERRFGRRGSIRWGPRVLDLDIILQQSAAKSRARHRAHPVVPHPGLASRDFVLQPLEQIASDWRHPRTGLSVRHMRGRLHRAKSVAKADRLA